MYIGSMTVVILTITVHKLCNFEVCEWFLIALIRIEFNIMLFEIVFGPKGRFDSFSA